MSDNGDIKKLDRLLRFPELERAFGRDLRTIRRQSEAGILPPLVKDGGIVGMLESAVEDHFQKLRNKQNNHQN
jgi:predicted DNA-binding transcriptional regulator AlpA